MLVLRQIIIIMSEKNVQHYNIRSTKVKYPRAKCQLNNMESIFNIDLSKMCLFSNRQ